MSIQLAGFTGGVVAEVDSNRNQVAVAGLPAHPSAGGYYTATGGPAGIVAAALAADTSLVALRFSASSTRKAYITKLKFTMSPATLGAAAGVTGSIGWQRFTTATPSGGTARTVNELNEALTTATDMTSVQDLAAALTVTSVVFGGEVARIRVPLSVGTVTNLDWELSFPDYPLTLAAGDGIVLRTRVAMAATQTWVFDWAAVWYEK